MKLICIFMLMAVVSFSACGNSVNNLQNGTPSQGNEVKEHILLPGISYAEEFVAGQDSSYMYQMDNNGSVITRAENGYYFRIGGAVFYSDENLEAIVPLCTKVNCKHIGEKECEACMGDTINMPTIQYYKGKVYFVSQEDLFSSKKEDYFNDRDIGNYEMIYALAEDGALERTESYKGGSMSPIIHRGYAYCNYIEAVEEEINGEKRSVKYAVISRINLETDEEERIIDRTTKEVHDYYWVQNIYAYRNYVYFCTQDEGIYMYNILDGSIKQIEDTANVNFWFMDDKIIYKRYYANDEDESCKIYIADLDFSNSEYIFSLEEARYHIGADDKYIYVDNRITSEVIKGGDRILYYYDKNTYEYLGEINLGKDVFIERYGYGDEKYYFYFSGNDLMYFEKADLATGNVELKMLFER